MTKSARNLVTLTVAAVCFMAALAAFAIRSVVLKRYPGSVAGQGRVIRRPPAAAPVSQAAAGALNNIAPLATVTVSSERDTGGQTGEGVADGVPDEREWVAGGETGSAWIRLDWDRPATVAEILLYELPSPLDNVVGGTLSFDDGSAIAVAPLPPDGKPRRIAFPPKTIRSVTFRIDRAQGEAAGLAEIMVIGSVDR
jgi:hypothetical protein